MSKEVHALVHHAQQELGALVEGKDDRSQLYLNDLTLCLIEKLASYDIKDEFVKAYVISAFTRLAKFKPLTPLTGSDDEWLDVSAAAGYPLWQNKRCPSVYKNADNIAIDTEKVLYSYDGATWFRQAGEASQELVIQFPYSVPGEPKRVRLKKDDSEGVSETDQLGMGREGEAEES